MGLFKLSAIFLLTLLQWKVHGDIPVLNCPPNSEYGTISACETNCSNIANPPVEFCIEIGILTCKCNEGLLAQTGTSGESVKCVKPEQCKVPCGPNKHYNHCASSCQPTCEQPTVSEICDKKCSPKCVCNEGYILSGDKCVKPRECKKP